jgi:succinate dehydrogenase/fumarate reductase cytochrome b subunit
LRFLGDLDWTNWIIPSACLVGNDMVSDLLLRGLAPLVVFFAVPVFGVACSSAAHVLCRPTSTRTQDGSQTLRLLDTFVMGLLDWLPLSLIIAFCFTPAVSASVFRAWRCVRYAFDDFGEERSFLAHDPAVRCDGSPEHSEIIAVAWVLVAIWPLGMVLAYAALLVPCRFMLLDETASSPLVEATSFLHRDYKPAFYYWEVLALTQRTVLTGWYSGSTRTHAASVVRTA